MSLKPGAGASLFERILAGKTPILDDETVNALRNDAQFRTLTRQQQRHVERGYFGTLSRQNIRYNPTTKKFELTYYSNDNPNSSRAIALTDISTERSEADTSYKLTIVVVNFAILTACALAPFAQEIIALVSQANAVPTNLSIEVVGFVAAAVLVASFALLSRSVENHLVHVDADWTNAINEAFNYTDVFVQMGGIRRLLLKFRQFIKWRRFVNFFIPIFATFSTIVASASLTAALLYASLDTNEALATLLFAGGLYYAWHWLWQVRVEHTDWRDPTVQLSVMVAGMHQRYVENKIVGVGGSSHSASAPAHAAHERALDQQLGAAESTTSEPLCAA